MTLSSIVIKVSDVNSVSNSIEKKKEERFSFSIEESDPPTHLTPFTPQLDSESCRILGGMVARTHMASGGKGQKRPRAL